MVGLRLVQCEDNNVLVGFCNSTEGCCGHYPNLRETFPEKDFPSCKAESLGKSTVCQVAKMIVEDLGGEAKAKLLLTLTPGTLDNDTVGKHPGQHQLQRHADFSRVGSD